MMEEEDELWNLTNPTDHSNSMYDGNAEKKKKTQTLLNIACALEGVDASMFPASFRALEVEMGITPQSLGLMSFVQAFAGATSSLVWGYLCDHVQRRELLLVCGCAMWGIIGLCLSGTSSFVLMVLLRLINGIALASINPISQTILADITDNKHYGFAFGVVQVAIAVGTLVGSWMFTSLSEIILFGIKGWRFAFLLVGVISLLFSFILYLHSTTRRPSQRRYNNENIKFTQLGAFEGLEVSNEEIVNTAISHTSNHRRIRVSSATEDSVNTARRLMSLDSCLAAGWPMLASATAIFEVMYRCFQIPTFNVIVLQGIFGSCPWSALSFLILYFQYCGLPNTMAAAVASCVTIGMLPGSLLGGYIGDRLNGWNASHGRPLTAQISVLLGMPFIYAVLHILPKTSPLIIAATHGPALFLFGVLSSWCGVAVNRPILLEIMEPQHKGQMIALLVAIEGSAAAIFGAPLTALLAEKSFGYQLKQKPVSEMEYNETILNRDALGSALTIAVTVPFLLCFICYGLLHFTLKKDRRVVEPLYPQE